VIVPIWAAQATTASYMNWFDRASPWMSTDNIHILNPGGASASDIRQKLQTSPRILIPLHEYLDRRKITRRQSSIR